MKREGLRILVSNDDGVHARGLDALEEIANALSDDVWVVAPEQEQSGAARALSLSSPIRVRKVHERKFSVMGTPTDCVTMGLAELIDGREPDLILSGVNHGQNMAEDCSMSGTIAAALQGMTFGIPSIALSQARFNRERIRFQTARAHAPAIVDALLSQGWPDDVVMNINFPDTEPDEVKGVEITRQGRRDQNNLWAERRTDLRGRSYYWFGFKSELSDAAEGTDLRAVYDGRISVTPLHLSLTHEETRERLTDALAGPPSEDN